MLTSKTLEEQLKKSRVTVLNKFCPIIKAKCRVDCACYYAGEIKDIVFNGNIKPTLYIAYCDHVLINSSICIES